MEAEHGAFEAIEAAESEADDLGLELKFLRDRVDLLNVHVGEHRTPWYRDVRLIVCVLALAVSFFSLAHAYLVDRADELRANRRDLKKIIQTLAEVRLTNAVPPTAGAVEARFP